MVVVGINFNKKKDVPYFFLKMFLKILKFEFLDKKKILNVELCFFTRIIFSKIWKHIKIQIFIKKFVHEFLKENPWI